METVYEANLIGSDLKIAIVTGRFNDFITSRLLDGAVDGLVRHGVNKENIDTAWVPGAFELPLVAKKMAETKNTTQSSHWAPSFVVRQRIMITSAARRQKALRKLACRQAFPSFLVCSRRRRSNKPLNVLAQKPETKVTKQRSLQLKWAT